MQPDDAAAILDSISNQIIDYISDDNRIEIRNFGTFQSRIHASKVGYNPSTGKPMHLDSGKTVLFKPSRELIKKMNG